MDLRPAPLAGSSGDAVGRGRGPAMRRDARLLGGLAALVAGLALISLLTGPAGAGPRAGLEALWTGEGPLGIVLREIRAPRTLLGIMVGISLGLSGAALQGYLRNPLA